MPPAEGPSTTPLGSPRQYRLLLGLEVALWSVALLAFVNYRSDNPVLLGRYSPAYAPLLAVWGGGALALALALLFAGRSQPWAERGLIWLRDSLLRRGMVSAGLIALFVGPLFLTDAWSSLSLLVALGWLLAWIVVPLCVLWLRQEGVKELGSNFSLALASLGLTLALLTGLYTLAVGRLGLGGYAERHHYFYDLLQPDADVGWRLRPNLEAFTYTWLGETDVVTSDALGFRNQHPTEGNPIAVVADSFGFGSYMAPEENWVSQVEARTGLAVANYAIGGYALWNYNQVMRHYVVRRGHRLVLYAVYVNDLGTPDLDGAALGDIYHYYGWDQYRDPWTYVRGQLDLLLNSSVGYWRRQGAGGLMAPASPLVVMANGLVVFNKEGVSAAYVEEGRYEADHRRISEANDLARAHDMDLLVLLFPSKESAYREQFMAAYGDGAADLLRGEEEGYRLLCDFVRGLDTLCYDLTDDLRQRASDSPLLYLERDAHWSAAGNLAVGELVSDFLLNSGLLEGLQRAHG